MVTLLCFCCDHRNPAGAKFCNACGTPLHLKPCKHCEAINARAAAHCHQCGETFALDFLSLDEAEQLPAAPVETAGETRSAGPERRGVVTTRIAAVLLGLMATALLSAYFAYRHPGGALDAAVDGGSTPAGSAIAPGSLQAMPPHAEVSSPPAPLSAPAERPDTLTGPAGTVADAGVNGGARPAATAAQPPSARPRPGAKSSIQAGATKSKTDLARRAGQPTPSEPVAIRRPASNSQLDPPPQPDPGPIALQQAVAAPAARAVAADPAPVQRPRASARRPAPAIGTWDRPCAEGATLDSSCDIRTMPKGN